MRYAKTLGPRGTKMPQRWGYIRIDSLSIEIYCLESQTGWVDTKTDIPETLYTARQTSQILKQTI